MKNTNVLLESCAYAALSLFLITPGCGGPDPEAPADEAPAADAAAPDPATSAEEAEPEIDQSATATVFEAQGEVTIEQVSSETTPATVGMPIADGERIITGPKGKATVAFADGSKMRVSPRTTVVVSGTRKEGRSLNVILVLGQVWNKVTSAVKDDTRFEVHTANAVAGVRGTAFGVRVGLNGKTTVRVKEGAVAVKPRARKGKKVREARVEAGNQAKVASLSKEPTAVVTDEVGDETWAETPEEIDAKQDEELKEASAEMDNLVDGWIAGGKAADADLTTTIKKLESLEAKQAKLEATHAKMVAKKKTKKADAIAAKLKTIGDEMESLELEAQTSRAQMQSNLLLAKKVTVVAQEKPEAFGGTDKVQAIEKKVTKADVEKASVTNMADRVRKLVKVRERISELRVTTGETPAAAASADLAPAPAQKKATPDAIEAKELPGNMKARRLPAQGAQPVATAKPAGNRPDERFEEAAKEALQEKPPAEKRAFPAPDPIIAWKSVGEIKAAMSKLTRQMDMVVRRPDFATPQKVELLEERIEVIEAMSARVDELIPEKQSAITRAAQQAQINGTGEQEGKKLFGELQALKALKGQVDRNISTYRNKVKSVKGL